jgi:hypothetical protein
MTLAALLHRVSPAPSATHAASPRFNVVILLADDLGWRDLGCTGSPFYETPAIDPRVSLPRLPRSRTRS